MTFDDFLAIVAIGKSKESARVYGVHLLAWRGFCEERGLNPLAPTPQRNSPLSANDTQRKNAGKRQVYAHDGIYGAGNSHTR